MNELIKKQLYKLQVAPVPNFNDDTTEIIFEKFVKIELQENNYYLIELNDNLLNPNLNSTLVVNWNGGKVPKHKYYKVDVVKIMGQMVKVNGLAFDKESNTDLDDSWFGWFTLKDVKVLKKI